MPKMTLEVAKEYGTLPVDTLILVEVDTITEREVPAKDGREGWQKLEFKFIIRDLPANLREDEGYVELLGGPIWGSVTARFTTHPDNKLRQWSEALLNMGPLDPGFELDTDLLLGRQAKAQISHYTRRDGNAKHQVESLLPPGPLGGAPVTDFYQRPTQAAPAAPAQASATQWAQAPAQWTGAQIPNSDDDPPF